MATRLKPTSSFTPLRKSSFGAGLSAVLLGGFFVIGCNDQRSPPKTIGQSTTAHTTDESGDALQSAATGEVTESDVRALADARARELLKDWGCKKDSVLQILPVKLSASDGGVWFVAVGFPGEQPQDWVELVVTPEGKVLKYGDWSASMWKSGSPEERERNRRWLLEQWAEKPTSSGSDPEESLPQTKKRGQEPKTQDR